MQLKLDALMDIATKVKLHQKGFPDLPAQLRFKVEDWEDGHIAKLKEVLPRLSNALDSSSTVRKNKVRNINRIQ